MYVVAGNITEQGAINGITETCVCVPASSVVVPGNYASLWPALPAKRVGILSALLDTINTMKGMGTSN